MNESICTTSVRCGPMRPRTAMPPGLRASCTGRVWDRRPGCETPFPHALSVVSSLEGPAL